MRQVGKWAAMSTPCRTTALACRSHAMVCAMDAAAGGQQHLRLSQLERRSARDQQQHPVHQQVGDEPLHLCSLEHFFF